MIEGQSIHTSKCTAIGNCFSGEYCDPFPLLEFLCFAAFFAIIIIINKICKSCGKQNPEELIDERNNLL